MDSSPPFNVFIQIDESELTNNENQPLCLILTLSFSFKIISWDKDFEQNILSVSN